MQVQVQVVISRMCSFRKQVPKADKYKTDDIQKLLAGEGGLPNITQHFRSHLHCF